MSARAINLSTTAADLLSLTKPRLASLVLFTAAGGVWMAPGHLGAVRVLATLLATAGTVGAANALNQYLERHSDRFMARTANRPLPSGRMEPAMALLFGLSLAAVSVPVLAVAANPLTALLGLAALLSYVCLYTPLKARTAAAMLVGGVPGALPPLMGYTAVTNQLDAPGLVLFSILFLWQMPHFIAIALFRKEEYRAAGLKSIPLERGDESARAQLLLYVVALLPVTLLPYQLKMAGGGYLVVAAALGVGWLAHSAVGFFRHEGPAWARKSFFYSLAYLSGLFIALGLDGGGAMY